MSVCLAPLDAEQISTVLEADIGRARTLPAEAYLSEDVLAWERQCLFDDGWVCLGRSELLPDRGSQRGVRIGSASILLTRNETGELRAFHNTCRHRGHELLADGECKRKRAIACPYHSWVYTLNGELLRASRFSAPGFDPADFPLVGIRAEEWLGWIFVNISAQAPTLEEWLGNLDEHLENWEPARLVLGAVHEYRVKANWKIIFENFVECYHCPSIHPELCRVSDSEGGNVMFSHTGRWAGGPVSLINGAETQSLTGRTSGVRFRRLTAEQHTQVRYFTLFPNLLISPHPDYLMTHRIIPLTPSETQIECSWLFPPESQDLEAFDPSFASDFWDRTNRQDFAACESVMRGMRSPGFRPGPFDGREVIVHAFQAMIARAYLRGYLEPPLIAPAAAAA